MKTGVQNEIIIALMHLSAKKKKKKKRKSQDATYAWTSIRKDNTERPRTSNTPFNKLKSKSMKERKKALSLSCWLTSIPGSNARKRYLDLHAQEKVGLWCLARLSLTDKNCVISACTPHCSHTVAEENWRGS